MTTAILEVQDLRVSFGGIHALDGASFAIEGGKTTGLIGPNGAGKTTLFNAISGFLLEIVLTEAGQALLPEAASTGSLRIATVMKAGRGGRRLVPSAPAARIDKSLVKALAWARDLRRRLEHGKSLNELAREDSCSRPYVSSLIRLAYLASDITHAIANGTQPAQLTLADLMSRDIPLDWAEQRRSFGFL